MTTLQEKKHIIRKANLKKYLSNKDAISVSRCKHCLKYIYENTFIINVLYKTIHYVGEKLYE